MAGCLKNAFATVGCVTVLAAAGVAGWEYRAQLAGVYHAVVGNASSDSASAGMASASAKRSAERKEGAMRGSRGPAYVVLNASEIASLIADGLAPSARASIDSIRVTLGAGRVTLDGRINTAVLSPDFLGPFKEALASEEPVKIAGPAHVVKPGVIAWTPDLFTVRAVPFPASSVPRLVNKITGRRDGAIPIAVPPAVADVRIRPDGVTFYRRTN